MSQYRMRSDSEEAMAQQSYKGTKIVEVALICWLQAVYCSGIRDPPSMTSAAETPTTSPHQLGLFPAVHHSQFIYNITTKGVTEHYAFRLFTIKSIAIQFVSDENSCDGASGFMSLTTNPVPSCLNRLFIVCVDLLKMNSFGFTVF